MAKNKTAQNTIAIIALAFVAFFVYASFSGSLQVGEKAQYAPSSAAYSTPTWPLPACPGAGTYCLPPPSSIQCTNASNNTQTMTCCGGQNTGYAWTVGTTCPSSASSSSRSSVFRANFCAETGTACSELYARQMCDVQDRYGNWNAVAQYCCPGRVWGAPGRGCPYVSSDQSSITRCIGFKAQTEDMTCEQASAYALAEAEACRDRAAVLCSANRNVTCTVQTTMRTWSDYFSTRRNIPLCTATATCDIVQC